MSYVPKYIMKRLVPQDAVKLVEGGVEIDVVNVISPIPADQIPGDPADIIDVKINGTALTKEEKSKVSITIDGNKIMFPDFTQAGTVPVGAKLVFFFPTSNYKKGEEVTVALSVSIVNVNIEFTRTIM